MNKLLITLIATAFAGSVMAADKAVPATSATPALAASEKPADAPKKSVKHAKKHANKHAKKNTGDAMPAKG